MIIVLKICISLLCTNKLLAHELDDSIGGFVNSADLYLAKDIISLVSDTTVQSKCDGNVFVVSKECEDFIGLSIMSLSLWAPPVTIVSFAGPSPFPESMRKLWTKFLGWDRRPCSLIFVCDLFQSVAVGVEENYFNNLTYDLNGTTGCELYEKVSTSTTEVPLSHRDEKLIYTSFPKFFSYADQTIYLSRILNSRESGSEMSSNFLEITETEREILQQTGILLWVGIRETPNMNEALMEVYSKCEFCGQGAMLHQEFLGLWQRNRTRFGFIKHFEQFQTSSSLNGSELTIGYFNHPPYFKCTIDANYEDELNCTGIEWEILNGMNISLHIKFSWVNLGSKTDQQRSNTDGNGNKRSIANISKMINALHQDEIDFALGGISVTSERIALIEFSKVFATEPIVFVVEKANNIFVLGIWLAFEPEVWPIILVIMVIISILFRIIINTSYVSYFFKPKSLSLSFYVTRSWFRPKKPALVRMFEALEITLQPLLGQPLYQSQITAKPRRLLKLLLVLWWFASLIITTLYSTSLITSLINPVRSREPESLKDLMDYGYYFKVEDNQGSVLELIASIPENTNTDDQLQRSFDSPQNNLTDDQQKTFKLLLKIKERLVKDSKNVNLVAYIMSESSVTSFNWTARSISKDRLKIIRERLFLNGYGFAMKPKTSYKEKIDTALSRLGSSGLIDHWYPKYQDKKVMENKFRLREKLSNVNLDLKILQGAFIFLVLGCGFSTVVFGIEHITKRYKFQLYTAQQVKSFLLKMKKNCMHFYDKHLAEEHPVVEANRNQKEKFRKAAVTIVKLNSRNPFNYVK